MSIAARGTKPARSTASTSKAGRSRRRFGRVAGIRNFARTEPLQKLAIVCLLGRAGHFVAATGDGVNDAPALDAAEIGATMGRSGRSGTEVARNAADLRSDNGAGSPRQRCRRSRRPAPRSPE